MRSPLPKPCRAQRPALDALAEGTESAHSRERLEAHAQSAGITRLNLETGSQDGFAPARSLYAKFGYAECSPFGNYVEDPNSTFMTKAL